MTRILATSIDDFQFRPTDTIPTRTQKLELLRAFVAGIIIPTDEDETFILPSHTHIISEVIGLQEALDALDRQFYYRFGAFWVAPPLTNETMMLHAVTDDIALPPAFEGTVGDIGGLPVAPMIFTVWKNPEFTAQVITGGIQIGTFTIEVDGTFTWETTDDQTQRLYKGQVCGVKAPAAVEGTAIGGSFTFLALLELVGDFLALAGDQSDIEDDEYGVSQLLLSGDQQSGGDFLVLAGE